MNWIYCLPLLIGAVTVVQAGLNRQISPNLGFPLTGVLNNFSGLCVAVALILILYFFSPKGLSRDISLHWWYFIPGALGMIFVMGTPYAISEIGASRTFILLVSGQMFFGMVWDHFVQGATIPWMRIIGVALAIAGATIANL
jgi:bacterial/archaeal transporter family-2 protein